MNEIRDYIARAPRPWRFVDGRMVCASYARLSWLATIARGTLDSRINRRAGMLQEFRPWHYPVQGSIRRNIRNNLRRAGHRSFCNSI